MARTMLHVRINFQILRILMKFKNILYNQCYIVNFKEKEDFEHFMDLWSSKIEYVCLKEYRNKTRF